MLEDSLASGALKPGQHVVELTSGNTGTGLAIAAQALGLRFTAVMSAGNSVERARMMRALGAEVVIVPQAPGSKPGAVSGADLQRVQEGTARIVRERGAFRADQFALESNERAHFLGTGAEIVRDTGGKLDAFVDFAGTGAHEPLVCRVSSNVPRCAYNKKPTGGSFSGVAMRLKAHSAAIQCFVVEPTSAQHRIQGGGYFTSPDGSPLVFIERARGRGHIDGVITVDDGAAVETARLLAQLEGVFAGFSTGANVAAAARVIEAHRSRGGAEGLTVACLACDSGLKYLSTDLYA